MLVLSKIEGAIDRLKEEWRAFRRAAPGQRFQDRYRQQKSCRADQSGAKRVISLVLAPLALVVGVVLMFIPGPAILFFFIGGTLLASHSLHVARAFDWAELKLRSWARHTRKWWKSRGTLEKLPVLLGAILVIVGGSLTAIAMLTSAR